MTYYLAEKNGKRIIMMKIDDLKEVFELATNAGAFINELMKIKSSCKTKVSDKDDEKIKSSGDYAQVASSGDYAQVASSGDYAQVASSGYSAQVASSGDYAVVAAIGYNNIACAKKDSWITLAEYRKNDEDKWYPYHVKTEQVDGETIKEDVFYILYNKQFREVEEIDGLKTVILSRKKNVWKTKLLGEATESFVFSKNGVNAHGRTVKQAYRDWLFKTSPRNMQEYEGLKLSDVRDINYWAVCYRTITGACSMGTENFIETFKNKLKPQMSLQEVIDVTDGQYQSHVFKDFFSN